MFRTSTVAIALAFLALPSLAQEDPAAFFRIGPGGPGLASGPNAPGAGGNTIDAPPQVNATGGTWRIPQRVEVPVTVTSTASYTLSASWAPWQPSTLILDTDELLLSGIPEVDGAFDVTFEAIGPGGTGTHTAQIRILPRLIATITPPVAGPTAQAVSIIPDATGIVGTPTWELINPAGDLPDGLTFRTSDGAITGTTNDPVTLTGLVLKVYDGEDQDSTETLPFTLAFTARSCSLASGSTMVSGASRQSYLYAVAPYGGSCSTSTTSCYNGTVTGPESNYATCALITSAQNTMASNHMVALEEIRAAADQASDTQASTSCWNTPPGNTDNGNFCNLNGQAFFTNILPAGYTNPSHGTVQSLVMSRPVLIYANSGYIRLSMQTNSLTECVRLVSATAPAKTAVIRLPTAGDYLGRAAPHAKAVELCVAAIAAMPSGNSTQVEWIMAR